MFSLKRFILNCRCQAEIKAKSTVQTPFLKKSTEMQLLNSNIPQGALTTKYSDKKAQDLLNLVLFVCCSFFVLQRWWTEVDSNHRSRRRQIYSLIHLAALESVRIALRFLNSRGAGDWNRTHNLLITNQLLCQLSYTGVSGASRWNRTADRGIFSPLLYRLSYRGIWRPKRGSNS